MAPGLGTGHSAESLALRSTPAAHPFRRSPTELNGSGPLQAPRRGGRAVRASRAKSGDPTMTDAKRQRERYAEDPQYRQRKRDHSNAWARANRDKINARQRTRYA